MLGVLAQAEPRQYRLMIVGAVEHHHHATPTSSVAQHAFEKASKRLGAEHGADVPNELTGAQIDHAKARAEHAMDLRVGACKRTGSSSSRGTHMPQLVPCCWKWHSTRLYSATSAVRARRRSLFYRRHFERIGLSDFGAGLAKPKAHLAK